MAMDNEDRWNTCFEIVKFYKVQNNYEVFG